MGDVKTQISDGGSKQWMSDGPGFVRLVYNLNDMGNDYWSGTTKRNLSFDSTTNKPNLLPGDIIVDSITNPDDGSIDTQGYIYISTDSSGKMKFVGTSGGSGTDMKEVYWDSSIGGVIIGSRTYTQFMSYDDHKTRGYTSGYNNP